MNSEKIHSIAQKISTKYHISEDFIIPKLIFTKKKEKIQNKDVFSLLLIFPQDNNIKNVIIFK